MTTEKELLTEYLATRSTEARDRLAEACFPWVKSLAEAVSRKMRLRDVDNAVGDALAHFALTILPKFDGSRGSSFKGYVSTCIRNHLVDQNRRQFTDKSTTMPTSRNERSWCESIPDRSHPPRGADFTKLCRWLPDRQAVVLKMKYKDYHSAKDVAKALDVSTTTIKHVAREAIRAVRIHWGAREEELLKSG